MHFQMACKLKKAGVKIETKKFVKMKMNSATCKRPRIPTDSRVKAEGSQGQGPSRPLSKTLSQN